MSGHVYAEGDLVRVRGLWGLYKIVRFDLVRGEAELVGMSTRRGAKLTRYVDTMQLLPAKVGDQ